MASMDDCFRGATTLTPVGVGFAEAFKSARFSQAFTNTPRMSRPYGVRGFAGNVADWCLDRYTRDGSTPEDGRLPPQKMDLNKTEMRVYRGGMWNAYEAYANTFIRFADGPEKSAPMVGFRIARSLIKRP